MLTGLYCCLTYSVMEKYVQESANYSILRKYRKSSYLHAYEESNNFCAYIFVISWQWIKDVHIHSPFSYMIFFCPFGNDIRHRVAYDQQASDQRQPRKHAHIRHTIAETEPADIEVQCLCAKAFQNTLASLLSCSINIAIRWSGWWHRCPYLSATAMFFTHMYMYEYIRIYTIRATAACATIHDELWVARRVFALILLQFFPFSTINRAFFNTPKVVYIIHVRMRATEATMS